MPAADDTTPEGVGGALALLDTLFASAPVGLAFVDAEFRYVRINAYLAAVNGVAPEDHVGRTMAEVVPELAPTVEPLFRRVMETGEPVLNVEVSGETTAAPGLKRYWLINYYPVRPAGGAPVGVGVVVTEVTEQRLAEERLLRAQRAARLGRWDWDLLTGEVVWSDGIYELLGLAPGAFAGTLDDFYEYVHEEDRGRVAAEVGGAVAEGRGYVIEFRYWYADGSLKWMEGRGRAVYSAEGRPTNVFGIGIDITDRKRAELNAGFLAEVVGDSVRAATPEEIVSAVGARLNRFLGTSTCAFVEIDEAAETATINYEWHEEGVPSLTGAYKLSEFVTPEFLRGAMAGETLVLRDVGADARIADPASWSALKIGAHVNVPLVRKGEWRFSLCVYHSGPYDWREDEVRLLEELAARVWARLERTFAERERERLLEWESSARLRAEEANRLKDEFLATVSHELRTPLTAITGWAHLLETGNLDREMARHAVSVIKRNCEQQRQIVEDVLDVSRFIAGKLKLGREQVDLSEVVLAALETVRPAAEAKNILLRSELKPCIEVWGDPHRLQQVVWNLLTNAVKFTPPGGRVSVGAGRLLTHARRGERHGAGHRAGLLAARLRPLPPGRRLHDAPARRARAGALHRPPPGRGARRSVHAYSAGEGQGATFTIDLPLPVGAPATRRRRRMKVGCSP